MKDLVTKKNIKLATTIIGILLLIQIVFFVSWYYYQPTQEDRIINLIETHQAPNGGYFEQIGDENPSLEATFYALSTLSMLNNEHRIDVTKTLDFVMSQYDTDTGLFLKEDEVSIETTYSAIGTLSILRKLDSINRTKVISAVMGLKTNDSLYRDVDEDDPFHQNLGELDHLFQAVSIYDKLYTNQTKFYLQINRTEIAISLASHQNLDGGMKEGIIHPISNMRNAYYTLSIITKLNSTVGFFEQYGFSSAKLIQWMDNQFVDDGFKMHSASEPTSEATAYALITYSRLGWTTDRIKSQFKEATEDMVKHLSFSLDDEESFSLDAAHDIVLALHKMNTMHELQNKHYSESIEKLFAWIFGLTIALLIMVTLVGIYLTLLEDDQKYFDVALRAVIKNINTNFKSGKEDLSKLLGYELSQIVLIPHTDEKVATLRSISEEYEFLISFEFDTWEPRELSMIHRGTSLVLLTLTFFESHLIQDVQKMFKKQEKEE